MNGVSGAVGCPFFSQAQWFAAWLGAFAGEDTVVRAHAAEVEMPFLRRVRRQAGFSLNTLQAPVNEHSPCLRLPCVPGMGPALMDEALRELHRREPFDWIDFPLLPADVPEGQVLGSLVERGWPLTVSEHPHTALVDLEGGWEAVQAAMSKKLRANTNRAENGLRRLGELHFDDEARNEWTAAWQTFLQLEAAGWKGEAQGAIASDARLEAFYERVLGEAHRQGRLRLYVLRLDDRPIGANLVLVDGTTAFGWKTAYDQTLAKYSPGNVLQRFVLRALAEEGVSRLDMLDPVNDWKRRWASRIEPRLHVRLYAPTLRGRLLQRLERARRTGKEESA